MLFLCFNNHFNFSFIHIFSYLAVGNVDGYTVVQSRFSTHAISDILRIQANVFVALLKKGYKMQYFSLYRKFSLLNSKRFSPNIKNCNISPRMVIPWVKSRGAFQHSSISLLEAIAITNSEMIEGRWSTRVYWHY